MGVIVVVIVDSLSTSSQMLICSDRSEKVRTVSVSWDTGCVRVPRDASFPVSQIQKKARSLLHNKGSTSRSDHLWACFVSAMAFDNESSSSEDTSENFSVSSSENGTYEKKTYGSFSAS